MVERGRGFRAWWEWMLTKPITPRVVIVEIEKGVQVPKAGDEVAIASLVGHPGMTALCNRLRLKRAALETQLKTVRHKDIRDVDFIQLGLFWLGMVESEINAAATSQRAKRNLGPSVDAVEDFQKILSSIESVGHTSPE